MPPEINDNVRENLAGDQLTETLGEEQATEVITYFTTSPEAKMLGEKKDESLRRRIEGKMSVFQAMKEDVAGVIIKITNEILEEARSKNMTVSYTDESGTEHKGGYIGHYIAVLNEVGVDFDDDNEEKLKKDAKRIVARALESVPLNVRPKYVHQYADEIIRAFVKEMADNDDVFWEIGSLEAEDLK